MANEHNMKTPPPQHEDTHPGHQTKMDPQPQTIRPDYRGSEKLKGKKALITGGDSGIGRAVAVHFAREGADVAFIYLHEHKDADETKALVEKEGRKCFPIAGDIGEKAFSEKAVKEAVEKLGGLDILVNNAGVQYEQKDIRGITEEQLERTFRTNVFGMFFVTQAALDHLKEGAAIINTTSITAFKGHPELLDYSSTKGAILAFTRAFATPMIEKGIRVNGVAPGPIWTPLVPSSFTAEEVDKFGGNTPLGRVGQPSEVAPAFVFLASEDSSFMTGHVIHVDGGKQVAD